MAQDKFPYSPIQCEKRMAEGLKPMLKDYMELNHSGAPALWKSITDEGTRRLMELMSKIMKGRVSFEPKKTLSSGFMDEE